MKVKIMNDRKMFDVILKNGQTITIEADEFSYGPDCVKFEDEKTKRWIAIFYSENIAGFVQTYPKI